jgi:Rrf2 family transcriptional regulator, cysteine metabolism repressor
MKISTKGRYGLRAMLDLAIHSNGEHISLLSIANRQDVSVNYLEQVFSILRKAGFVVSVKGAQGGYLLAMPASKLHVGDILRCLEGDLCVVDEKENNKELTTIQQCITENVWEKINAAVREAVDSITLEDLVDDYNGINQYPMFYI